MGQNPAEIRNVSTGFACPYKKGQLRSVFAILFRNQPRSTQQAIEQTRDLYSELLPRGFFPGHTMALGNACPTCNSCVSLRIQANDYQFSRHEKKILNANADLKITMSGVSITHEHFSLFKKYTKARHPENADYLNWMASDLQNYLEPHSNMLEFRDANGRLLSFTVFDVVNDGLSGFNHFYDPDDSNNRRSLGTFSTLKLVELMKGPDRLNLYIGAWVNGSAKLDYKKRFHNLEMFDGNGWKPFDPSIHTSGAKPSRVIPIFPA